MFEEKKILERDKNDGTNGSKREKDENTKKCLKKGRKTWLEDETLERENT